MHTRAFTPLTLYILEANGIAIVEQDGVHYKTKPVTGVVRQAGTANGLVVMKNNDLETVIAECLGSALADLVGLSIPPWGITEAPGTNVPWFCSEMQLRTHAEDVLRRNQVLNPEIIADTIVFDIWTANDDRNMGGFVPHVPAHAPVNKVELLTIDFESCLLCRGKSIFEINSLPASRFRPRSEVSRHVPTADRKPYERMCQRLALLRKEQLAAAFDRLAIPSRGILQPLPMQWRESAEAALLQRAHKIGFILQEVLDARK